MSGKSENQLNVDDFLDFEHPADASAADIYARLRRDSRVPELIKTLQRRDLGDREIVILFRLATMIPSEWQSLKEAPSIAIKRRTEMSKRLKAILPHIDIDPDLSRMLFGSSKIEIGGAEPPKDSMFSLADCVREAIKELDAEAWAVEQFAGTQDVPKREIALKRFAILQMFSYLAREGRRSANAITAAFVSIILDEEVTANDVTQARKDVRRRYYRDEK